VSRLAFLSPDECSADVVLDSPLSRAASGGAVTDVSGLGKLEVRGELNGLEPEAGETLLPLGPGRALLVVEGPARAARERLAAQALRVYDMTAALAALELEGEDLMRRLTELDLERLPAIGSIARGTPALIERLDGERFRLFVPQELGHFVAEVVEDMAKGLGR
jgi:sarcosine oxidase gamma subunit